MVAILLIIIFARPFISSLAFPELNFLHSIALLLVLGARLAKRGIIPAVSKPLKLSLQLFCLALGISLIFSKDILAGIAELYKYICAVLLFIVVSRFTPKKRIDTMRMITLSGLVVSVIAIYQYFFGFQHLADYMSQHKLNDAFAMDMISRRRVFFPFVTPNTLAGFLAMVIPLTLALKKRTWLLLPMLAALLLTKSLGGLFCLFLSLGLYIYLRGAIDSKKVVFLSGIALVIGIVLLARLNYPAQHTQPLFSSLMRWNYWKQSMALIKVSPLVGIGIGNFNLNLSRYAHNSYLQIWAEMGILGLAAFLWLAFLSLRECIKSSKPVPGQKRDNLSAGIAASCTAFLIHNLIDFSFFLPEVALIWWVVLGLAASSVDLQ